MSVSGSSWLLDAKSFARRMLGIPDPWKAFRDFERRIHPGTWSGQRAVLDWLAEVTPPPDAPRPYLDPHSSDPLVRRFAEHWVKLERRFKGLHTGGGYRVLLLLPEFEVSPAGHSLFRNLGDGLAFCGAAVEYWHQGTSLGERLQEFRPTALIAIDHQWYGAAPEVGRATIEALRDYRKFQPLIVGMTAHSASDPADSARQLQEASELGFDFFLAFHAEPFASEKYQFFVNRGARILSLEFGANPLMFYPVPGVVRDLDFVYLASSNFEKWERAAAFLDEIFQAHAGVVLGPGWPRAAVSRLPDDQLRYLCARARVGINLHVPFQIREATELNERAYNLAACGTPQLMDNPALLPDRFDSQSVYTATSPTEYASLFRHILAHPEVAAERAANALDEVLARHTVFHRADRLIDFICEIHSDTALVD